MDKTKEYLALALKHHFWVISGVVLLASLTCWWLAERKLDTEREAQKTLIEGKFVSMDGISKTADHPNDKVTAELRKKVFGIGDNVHEAWVLRFQEQLKVPQWQGDLSDTFLNWIKTHQETDPIPVRLREEYQNFIKEEIKLLFKQVNARELVPIENPTVLPPNAPRPNSNVRNPRDQAAMLGVTYEWRGLVAWDENLRLALEEQYNWDRQPTSQQVRYANEDFWIYRALLDIIAKTNKGATEHLVASIKQIDALNIGPLVEPPTQFFVPAVAGPGAAGLGGEGGEGQMSAEGGMDAASAPPPPPGQGGGQPGAEGGEATAAMTLDQYNDAMLKHGRYVDAKGKPVGYKQQEPFAEFKIMPFEMRLLMDQRKVPELLANCANSPLPVEVRQVGITSTETPLASTGNAGGGEGRQPRAVASPRSRPGYGGGEGGMPSGRTSRPPPRSQMEGAGGGATDLGGAVELRPFDLHVEVRGVIYIFNKPDRSKVGKQPPPPEPVAAPAEAGAGG